MILETSINYNFSHKMFTVRTDREANLFQLKYIIHYTYYCIAVHPLYVLLNIHKLIMAFIFK